MAEYPLRLTAVVNWVDGLPADPDDGLGPVRGGWFADINLPGGKSAEIPASSDYPADGWETPGDAVNGLVKWANDRNLTIGEMFTVVLTSKPLPAEPHREGTDDEV